MSTTTTRTLEDRVGAIRRQIRALANTPEEWEPIDLMLLDMIEHDIERVWNEIVHGLRDTGNTDRQIGEALGVTQQAVSKRWPGGGRYVGAAGRYRTPAGSDGA